MHYGNKDFSKNGLPTIEAIGDQNKPLGQDIGFSALDIQKLKAHYDCDARKLWDQWLDNDCCRLPVKLKNISYLNCVILTCKYDQMRIKTPCLFIY